MKARKWKIILCRWAIEYNINYTRDTRSFEETVSKLIPSPIGGFDDGIQNNHHLEVPTPKKCWKFFL